MCPLLAHRLARKTGITTNLRHSKGEPKILGLGSEQAGKVRIHHPWIWPLVQLPSGCHLVITAWHITAIHCDTTHTNNHDMGDGSWPCVFHNRNDVCTQEMISDDCRLMRHAVMLLLFFWFLTIGHGLPSGNFTVRYIIENGHWNSECSHENCGYFIVM